MKRTQQQQQKIHKLNGKSVVPYTIFVFLLLLLKNTLQAGLQCRADFHLHSVFFHIFITLLAAAAAAVVNIEDNRKATENSCFSIYFFPYFPLIAL